MAQPKQAKRTIRLEDVPSIPEALGLEIISGEAWSRSATCANGDSVVTVGDQRWRFNAEGKLKYYIRYQAGQGPDVTPYEEMYRDRTA